MAHNDRNQYMDYIRFEAFMAPKCN